MNGTRRAFFRSLSVAAMAAVPDASRGAANEDYWSLVKRQFPLEDGLIYLNAANVCPASRPVMDRHLEYLRDFHANPSFQNRDKYEPLAERLRKKMGALMGASAEEVAFTRNTSEASNTVVGGINLKAGDEIIITSHNHPSNNDSWKVRAKRHGLVIREAPVPVPARSRQELIDGIARLITDRTRVIAFTHCTNTTGVQYPAKEICAIGRQRNIWVHVDGAQTFGAFDVNLHEMACDSYSGSAHKWMMGPLEAGLLYVRAERISELWPSVVTAGWSDRVAGARKFEVYGQRDNPRLVAFEAAVDFVQLIGMKAVEARMKALAARAMRGLADLPGVMLKTNPDPALSGGVVKFHLTKLDTKAAYDKLYSRHRMGIASTLAGESQGLRISAHIYNSMDEMDRAVAAVRELTA
jgi:selenocysteine lyase/cysteine desulfurase